MLQALNILENFDLKSMGYNSARYINTLYQTMSLAFADRDFYYGDPYFPPEEPIKGLLDKAYSKQRAALINPDKNNPNIGPGDPYPFEGKTNPYLNILKQRGFNVDSDNKAIPGAMPSHDVTTFVDDSAYQDRLWRGTTSVEAADKDGWVVSITPSGGWLPACIAGHTGVGMSQRLQSFVLDSTLNPFNVIEPGKKPRVTLTPTLAIKDGKPFMAFAVQGGDTQDQNLLQCFLNVVEFGMTIQEAVEAANINTDQLWLSLGGEQLKDRQPHPGNILLNSNTPDYIRRELMKMGYKLSFDDRTSGPINAIYFDWKHGSFWGGSSNYGEDYGIGW
jgi:gamma-glutamyltranspeptidase/glutathione hydrolase